MTNIALTSTTASGLLQTDFDQLKGALQSNTTALNPISIVNTGTTAASSIVQSGNIAGSNGAIYLNNSGNTGHGLFIYADQASPAQSLAYIYSDNATFNESALKIRADGTGNSLFIDQNGDRTAIAIDTEATSTSSYGLSINATGGGRGILVDQNSDSKGLVIDSAASTAGNNALEVFTNGGARGIFVDQDGAADGLSIDQDGAGSGLLINTAATGHRSLEIVHVSSNNAAIDIECNSTSQGIYLRQQGNGAALMIKQDNDVEIIDFDNCTDGGTGHTTEAGSIKVQMPDGTTGYINFYT